MANLPIDPQRYYVNPLHVVPTWAEDEGVVYMIVEINKGTITKYELVTETGQLKVDRVGYSSLAYPFEYGAVPQTLDGDGDPIDIMLVNTTEKLVPGCLIEARVIGLMEMMDDGEVDDKVIAVPNNDKRFDHIKDITDLPEYFFKETKYYWEHYKDLKKENIVQVKEFKNKAAAIKTIKECEERYNKDYRSKVK
jgi:inorganic pyrophosphatase